MDTDSATRITTKTWLFAVVSFATASFVTVAAPFVAASFVTVLFIIVFYCVVFHCVVCYCVVVVDLFAARCCRLALLFIKLHLIVHRNHNSSFGGDDFHFGDYNCRLNINFIY